MIRRVLGRRSGGCRVLIAQIDGAVGSGHRGAGLGVVLRDQRGAIRRALKKQVGRCTNNEAEYAALVWALELLGNDPPEEVHVVSDSEIVVQQMRGRFSVKSPVLRRLHR